MTAESDPFSKKVRVRACGLLKNEQGILLLKHIGVGPAGFLWSPPGGGVKFGDSLEATVIREFLEETQLTVQVMKYLFTNEFLGLTHHAIEVFYEVKLLRGEIKLGKDPELPDNQQILADIKFMSNEDINRLPLENLHNVFHHCDPPSSILSRKGLFNFHENSIE